MSDFINLFDEIWREWGLRDASEGGAQARRKALTALKDWLDGASSQPVRLFQAVQTLLAHPEVPSSPQNEAVKAVAKVISGDWNGYGGTEPNRDLQFLQAMLLAVWPREGEDSVLGLACLWDTPWEVMKGRDAQKSRIRAWQAERRRLLLPSGKPLMVQWTPSLTAENVSTSKFTVQAVQIPSEKELTAEVTIYARHVNNQTVKQPPIPLLYKALVDLNAASTANAQQLQEWLERLGTETNRALANAAQQTLNALQSLKPIVTTLAQAQTPPAELNLLWWGQARYSYLAEKPFRLLHDPDEVLLLAAEEIGERARTLPPEPTCAYLLETLHALGQDLHETQPLREWALRLLRALQKHNERLKSLSTTLAEWTPKAALGLPVTQLRLLSQKSAGEEQLLSVLETSTQLDLSQQVSRATWASWVQREFLLSWRLAQLRPAREA